MEEKLNTLNEQFDFKTKNVLGFLIGKELLWTNQYVRPYHGKIKIKDALWVAENVEPRVLEVLPAAMIHFPKVFIGLKGIPKDLKTILLYLRKGHLPPMETWNGIETQKMFKWANIRLKDKRTKPISLKKSNRTFSLSKKTSEKLKKLSIKNKITETSFLEKLIDAAV